MSDATTATPEAPKAENTAPGGKPQPESATDWQAKFEAQQKVNRDLETKFNGLRDSQTKQTEALASALGLKPEEAPDVSVLAATVRTLQEQFSQTQLDNAVLTVATQHGITEKADIDLLRSVKDESTMRTIAARIAAGNTAGSDSTTSAPGPRPDLSQGASGTPAAGDPAAQFGRFLADQMNR
jgi:hypothetical protein